MTASCSVRNSCTAILVLLTGGVMGCGRPANLPRPIASGGGAAVESVSASAPAAAENSAEPAESTSSSSGDEFLAAAPVTEFGSASAEKVPERAEEENQLAAAAPATGGGRAAKASAADWPGFRGPDGMGKSSAQGLPEKWSADEGIAWKTPLPGPGASSPIVFGDRVYLTCWSGYLVPDEPQGSLDELKRHLVAVQLSDGKIVWDKTVQAKLPEERSIRDHGYAANTPAADAERVYVFFGKTGVFAFDHSGEQVWQADVGSNTSGWGTAASPVIYKDLLIINASVESGSLIALDKTTGEERWRADGINESWNTPIIATAKNGRQELIVAKQGKVLAYAPDTGEPLWNCDTDIGWYMVPSIVAADGVVYCLGGRSGTAALAIRTGGEGDVTRTHRLWTSESGSNVSSPVVHGGHLYWMNDQRGIAYCAKVESGEVVYEQRLDRAGQVYASALLADGRLYYLTRNGVGFVLAAQPEFEQLAANELGDRSTFNGTPAVAGSRLLIRSDKYLYCLGK